MLGRKIRIMYHSCHARLCVPLSFSVIFFVVPLSRSTRGGIYFAMLDRTSSHTSTTSVVVQSVVMMVYQSHSGYCGEPRSTRVPAVVEKIQCPYEL